MAGDEQPRLRALVLVVFSAGAMLCVLAWIKALTDPYLLLAAALASVAFVTAEALPAQVRHGVGVSLGSVVLLTALLIGGPVVAICAVVGAPLALLRESYGRDLLKQLFNTGQFAITAASASGVFVVLGGTHGSLEHLSTWATWVALMAGAVTYTIVNHTLVALAVRFSYGERILSTIGSVLASSMFLQLLYAGLALLAAALVLLDPWTIIFLVLPALVARHALLGYQREAEAYDRLVGALLKAIEVKDGYTAVHTERVSQLCVEVAREYGLDYNELRAVRYAAKLHDVGKLAVPQSIINKPAKLDHDEFELIKKHPTIGADILAEIEFLEPIIDGVRYHHERVDGDGYPFGLAGDEVPLLARIITVCDAFDAMTTTRSYRQAMEIDEAFDELYRCAGTQFDRDVVMVLEQVTQRLGWEPTRDAYTPQTSSLDEVGR